MSVRHGKAFSCQENDGTGMERDGMGGRSVRSEGTLNRSKKWGT